MKAELHEDDRDSAGIPEECETGDDDDPNNKFCAGCNRNAITGKCWVREGEPVVWALPQGRGAWCRDCFNVWRLRFAQKMPLVTMPYHFKTNALVITEFEVAIVAYISIRRGGAERVSGPVLNHRIELIEWIATAFGFPLGNFIVVPFSDIVGTDSPPATLVTLKRQGGFELGSLVSQAIRLGDGRAVNRPEGSCLGLRSRQLLLTDNKQDSAKLEEVFGRGAGDGTVNSAKFMVKLEPEFDTGSIDLSRSAKKVAKKVKSAVSCAQLLLHGFQGNEWEEMQ